MSKLDELLQFYEKNLDMNHVESTKKRLKALHNYEAADKISLHVDYPNTETTGYSYKDAFDDMEKMMYNGLRNYTNNVIDIKDDTVPMIRAGYGVGILPSLFGVNCRIINNNAPWVDHVENEDEIKKIIDKGVPDLRSGLGAKVFDTHEYYQEKLQPYEKCREAIRVFHPDLQGPFDVAHLIWGEDIFFAVYDNPELVHALLKLVTKTYIVFLKELKKTINDEDEEFCCHNGTLFKGKMLIRDDTPVLLSMEMFEEFVRPYDEMILNEFGGGSIHYCGRADQWVFNMMEMEKIQAMHFGQPPNIHFGFDFLEKIYDKAKEKKIALPLYALSKKLFKQVSNTRFSTGVSFAVAAKDRKEALELLEYTI